MFTSSVLSVMLAANSLGATPAQAVPIFEPMAAVAVASVQPTDLVGVGLDAVLQMYSVTTAPTITQVITASTDQMYPIILPLMGVVALVTALFAGWYAMKKLAKKPAKL